MVIKNNAKKYRGKMRGSRNANLLKSPSPLQLRQGYSLSYLSFDTLESFKQKHLEPTKPKLNFLAPNKGTVSNTAIIQYPQEISNTQIWMSYRLGEIKEREHTQVKAYKLESTDKSSNFQLFNTREYKVLIQVLVMYN